MNPPSNVFLQALEQALATVSARRRWVVAVSGGVDSMLLLDTVCRLRVAAASPVPVLVLHVHHGLSPNADAWAARVMAECDRRGVVCEVLRVSVDGVRASREAAAREARHAALAARLVPGDLLLLAHHADDQAETLLLRLFRGSGVTGLAAMRPVRPVVGVEDAWLARPFLSISRALIEAEARRLDLAWVDDESNTDARYDRNFLRHAVLPPLAQRWPAVSRTLADTARRLAQTDDLLNDYLDADLAGLLDGVGALDARRWLALPVLRRIPLLKRWLQRIGAPVFQEHWLRETVRLAEARDDSEGVLLVAGWELHRFRGFLHAFPQLPAPDNASECHWDLRGSIDLGPAHGCLEVTDGDGLQVPGLKPGDAVTLRFRRGGETLRMSGGTRPLKKLLQEHDVPPWLRAQAPLVCVGERIVACGDFFAATGQGAGVTLRWRPPERAFAQ